MCQAVVFSSFVANYNAQLLYREQSAHMPNYEDAPCQHSTIVIICHIGSVRLVAIS